MPAISKLPLLLSLAWKSPRELRDRIATFIEVRLDGARKSSVDIALSDPDRALDLLEQGLAVPIRPYLEEPPLASLEAEVSGAQQRLSGGAPFSTAHNGDVLLARFCYAIARAIKAATVLETGVAYGVSSAYLLQALEDNGDGALWSIDLPPLARHAADYVGYLIPARLTGRWHLRPGHSRRLLPELLAMLGSVDLFVQDSPHTYRNVTREVITVWPYLRPGGVVIVDDIERNQAFSDLSSGLDNSASIILRERYKDSYFGILVKPNHGG